MTSRPGPRRAPVGGRRMGRIRPPRAPIARRQTRDRDLREGPVDLTVGVLEGREHGQALVGREAPRGLCRRQFGVARQQRPEVPAKFRGRPLPSMMVSSRKRAMRSGPSACTGGGRPSPRPGGGGAPSATDSPLAVPMIPPPAGQSRTSSQEVHGEHRSHLCIGSQPCDARGQQLAVLDVHGPAPSRGRPRRGGGAIGRAVATLHPPSGSRRPDGPAHEPQRLQGEDETRPSREAAVAVVRPQ